MSLNDERSRYEQGFRDGVVILANSLSSHYPHFNSILRCIDVEKTKCLLLIEYGFTKDVSRFFSLLDSYLSSCDNVIGHCPDCSDYVISICPHCGNVVGYCRKGNKIHPLGHCPDFTEGGDE